MEKWNPDEVVATLQLLDPRRAAIGLTCKEVPADVGGEFDLKEPIYGTEYKQTRLSDEFLKDVSGSIILLTSECSRRQATAGAPIPELNLPPPNPFIPKRLDVEKFEVQEKALRPDLLKDTPLSRLWYKRDDTWWLPKTNVDVKLTRWVEADLHSLEFE
jgi:insulysin